MSKDSSAITHPTSINLSYRTFGWLLILIATAICSGRIFSVTRDNKTPFLSANDRSRWCTIRALVDHGTYQIDQLIFDEKGEKIKTWHTIDLVKHRGADGKEHYYSSKPVLMPTFMAGVYAVVKILSGRTLESDPFFMGKTVLWLCNIPPLVFMWWLLMRLIDEIATQEWTKIIALFAATLGTFLTTYTVALNNHLHAAVCVLATVYFFWRIKHSEQPSTWHFAACGLFAALVFANELPGLAFLVLFGGLLLLHDWRRTTLAFVPMSAGIVAAMVLLNYYAHQSWRPPYTHRHDGAVVASGSVKNIEALRRFDATEIMQTFDHLQIASGTMTPRLQVNPSDDIADRWNLFVDVSHRRYAVRLLDSGSGAIEIREWDNWYEYEGTNWQVGVKSGVDRGEASPALYAFHCLLGHHGLFSLTPILCFSFIGMCIWTFNSTGTQRWLGMSTLLLSVVCLGFYLTRPLHDRNYGGACNGLRWMMWFLPLYLLTMLPALDRVAHSRWGRRLVVAALIVGIFSASYKPLNCFSHPWIFDLLEHFHITSYAEAK
jgi:hypothetical protein